MQSPPPPVLYGDMKVEICVLMPKGPLSPEKRVEIFEALEGFICLCRLYYTHTHPHNHTCFSLYLARVSEKLKKGKRNRLLWGSERQRERERKGERESESESESKR
jgi:hypothetical protein